MFSGCRREWKSSLVRTPLQTATLGVKSESRLPVEAAKAAFVQASKGKYTSKSEVTAVSAHLMRD